MTNEKSLLHTHKWQVILNKPLKPEKTIQIFMKFKNTFLSKFHPYGGNLSLLANDNNVYRIEFGCAVDSLIDLNVYIEKLNSDLSTEEIHVPIKKLALRECEFMNEHIYISCLSKNIYLFYIDKA